MPRRTNPSSSDGKPALLTPAEAARVLGVSKATVYRLINDGCLASVAVGRSGFTRISAAAIARYHENRERAERASFDAAYTRRNRVPALALYIQKSLSPRQRLQLIELIRAEPAVDDLVDERSA